MRASSGTSVCSGAPRLECVSEVEALHASLCGRFLNASAISVHVAAVCICLRCFAVRTMSSPAAAVDVAELRRRVNEQGESVKALKKELKDVSGGKDDPRLKEALAKLMALKAQLDTAIAGNPEEVARLQAAKKAKEAEMQWRAALESVITQRGFYFKSNEIHPNTPSGFYDFGA